MMHFSRHGGELLAEVSRKDRHEIFDTIAECARVAVVTSYLVLEVDQPSRSTYLLEADQATGSTYL